MRSPLKTVLSVTAAAGLVALAGCSSGPAETLDNGDQQNLSIAVFNGWPEGEAVSYLWASILEDKGYNVELEPADLSAGFVGLAGGDYDINLDIWLPVTHADQLEEYGDEIEDLGAWYTGATNNIAVNADAPIDSLDELAANADYFNNTIVGIEPGAGLTTQTENNVIPGYGLETLSFEPTSTAAMLTELKAATDAGEGIAVTLAHPHWAYNAFPIKDLADPKGALGVGEGIHSFSRSGFADDFPVVAGWLADFTMESEAMESLQEVLFSSGADSSEHAEIVEDWIAQNQDWVDGLTA